MTSRLLVLIIVLQNHNRYNILNPGHNYTIDIKDIEKEALMEDEEENQKLECSGNKEANPYDLDNDPISKVFGSDRKKNYCHATIERKLSYWIFKIGYEIAFL